MVSAQRLKSFEALANLKSVSLPKVGEKVPVKVKEPEIKQETVQVTEDNDVIAGQQIYHIKLSRISPFKDQPRRYFDASTIELLSHSLEKDGQYQPIRVCPDPDNKGHFILIGGERRWRAFHKVQERTGREPLVKAIVDSAKSIHELFYKAVVDNLQREDLSPVDEAAMLAKLHDNGTSIAALANMVGKSVSYVDGYLKLNTLSDEVKEFMSPGRPKDKRLAITIAIQIARSTKNPTLRLELAKEMIERELGIREARFLIEKKTGYYEGNRNVHVGLKDDPKRSYRSFKSHLSKIYSTCKRIRDSNVDTLYPYREDEFGDRANDVIELDNLINLLKDIREQIEEK